MRVLAIALFLFAFCTEMDAEPPPQAPRAARDGPEADLPAGNVTFVRPNIRFSDGRAAYAHVTPDHMPWRIAIGRPKQPPKYGSSRKAREVAIEAMQMWEAAIQPLVPWFKLEFVEEDPEAPVQIEWKRRIPVTWAGFGRIEYRNVDGKPWVGGRMEISTTPDKFTTLTVDQVRLLVAHEFGHVLGLEHCLDCDSAMNYSWATRERILVTDLDARTFAELAAIPLGTPAE